MTRELSNTIHSISLTDAVDKALPIIIELGKDTDDSVREALAGELDKVIYFYYQVRIIIIIKKCNWYKLNLLLRRMHHHCYQMIKKLSNLISQQMHLLVL